MRLEFYGLCILRIMVGVMDDRGCLFGFIKFCGGGGRYLGGWEVGIVKLFILLLSIILVDGDNIRVLKG